MLLVKVLAAMHGVSTLFFFHLNWFVSSQIAYPRKVISRLGEINHGVTLFQTSVCESVVCDACKTPAVIAKPLNVLVLELFFIVGLFVCLALIICIPLTPLFLTFPLPQLPPFPPLIYASQYKPWRVLM